MTGYREEQEWGNRLAMEMSVVNRCEATVVTLDLDAATTEQCEAEEGHNGPHYVTKPACVPEALLCWRREIPVEEHA